MDIKIIDMDIVDINVKVAEQCLIKASIENNNESKAKALIFAKQSINNALLNLGINENSNIKRNKRSLVKNKA